MRHVLRGAARVADALQAHAVLVAPEVRRRGGEPGAAQQGAGDGGAAARGASQWPEPVTSPAA